ncbi:MAG: lysophospholipid acyltransferase family protein, partial [Gammaproteobacteria bacterium]|nr:lysophospholipid acyltransferase family protein [Gammaproteobacteria bacterium]
QLLKQSLIETGKTVIEASPMWQWDKNKLFSLIRKVHGEELIQQALDKNNGVILALPHLGNWELLGLYCSSKYTTTSMYQKPKMIEIDSIVKHGRERFGANLVPADHVGVKAMYKALKNNSCVCILPDQEPGKGNGVFAPFFGVPAYSMTLISRLAKKTKATVILAYSKRLPVAGGYEIIFSALPAMAEKLENVNPEDSVEYLNAEMEKHIRNISEQYQWSYKRFRTQPAEVLATLTGKDFYNL